MDQVRICNCERGDLPDFELLHHSTDHQYKDT